MAFHLMRTGLTFSDSMMPNAVDPMDRNRRAKTSGSVANQRSQEFQLEDVECVQHVVISISLLMVQYNRISHGPIGWPLILKDVLGILIRERLILEVSTYVVRISATSQIPGDLILLVSFAKETAEGNGLRKMEVWATTKHGLNSSMGKGNIAKAIAHVLLQIHRLISYVALPEVTQ